MRTAGQTPAAVLASVVFFASCGGLELGLGVMEAPRPLAFWPVWEALGRAILYWLLAAGLWNRLALCRTVALVYSLAALVTYAVVLVLALWHAPVEFPTSVVVSSLVQVPSCALLLPFLRSPEATVLFPRPLFRP
jgi:hypothetical protein